MFIYLNKCKEYDAYEEYFREDFMYKPQYT